MGGSCHKSNLVICHAPKQRCCISVRLSEELLHMLSSGYWTGIFEAVRHDMDREAAKKYFAASQHFIIVSGRIS